MNLHFYDTPIGKLGFAEQDEQLTYIFFNIDEIDKSKFTYQETPFIIKAFTQIDEYLHGKRKVFDLPLNPKGTEFMRASWNALISVPYGETRSYKDIAIQIGNPKAVRAVGMANNRNPIPIIIPCHRIIGSDNKLVGYRGGLDMKITLLELEQKYK